MIQAIIFDNRFWDATSSRAWLKKHYYDPIKRVDKTKHYLRYRLQEPKQGVQYRLHEIPGHIKLVLEFSENLM